MTSIPPSRRPAWAIRQAHRHDGLRPVTDGTQGRKTMSTDNNNEPVDENRLIAERRAKLDQLRAGGQAYPNDFRTDAEAAVLLERYADEQRWEKNELEGGEQQLNTAGAD